MSVQSAQTLRRNGTGWRFIVNGLVATAIHYGALVVLLEFAGLPHVGTANAIAACVGITASYVGNRNFVFRSQAPIARSMAGFVVLYLLLALLHFLCLTLWSDIGGLPYTPGFVIATALSALLTYLGNNHYVFRT